MFVYENIVALIEYTTLQESSISEHLKKKKVLYDKILRQPQAFVEFIEANNREFRRERDSAWPAPGSADTELGVLLEPEVCHGETKVYTRVQA